MNRTTAAQTRQRPAIMRSPETSRQFVAGRDRPLIVVPDLPPRVRCDRARVPVRPPRSASHAAEAVRSGRRRRRPALVAARLGPGDEGREEDPRRQARLRQVQAQRDREVQQRPGRRRKDDKEIKYYLKDKGKAEKYHKCTGEKDVKVTGKVRSREGRQEEDASTVEDGRRSKTRSSRPADPTRANATPTGVAFGFPCGHVTGPRVCGWLLTGLGRATEARPAIRGGPPMKIILANPRGFCAGVNMAIDSLETALRAVRHAALRLPRDRPQPAGRRAVPGPRRGVRRRHRRGPRRRHGPLQRPRRRPGDPPALGRAQPPGHRRHLPAGHQGPHGGGPVRPRRVHDRPDRPRGARRGGRHDGRGPGQHGPGRGRGRRRRP